MRLSKLLIIFSVAFAAGCSVDRSADEFAASLDPTDGRTSIAHLCSMYRYEPLVLGEELWIRGAVVSSDRGANVRRSVFVEDSTGGIEVLVDAENLFTQLFPGDSVTLRCGGLVLGGVGGTPKLGGEPRGVSEVSHLDEVEFFDRLLFEGHSATPPRVHHIKLKEVNHRYLGCLVCVEGVQFADEELDAVWCGGDEPETHYLVDAEQRRIGVRVVPSAEFAAEELPRGSGSITALLDYFGSEYQLRPVDLMDTNLTEERF